jgi:hypothetical protein
MSRISLVPSSSKVSYSSCNTDPVYTNNYNPSSGIFQPYLTKELENLIKTLKIDSASHKISNKYQDNTLVAVILLSIVSYIIIITQQMLNF